MEEGLVRAITEKNRPGGLRKLSARDEAFLVATVCSNPPAGAARWTLQLLADQVVACTDVEEVSIETIRRRLEEKEIKPWQKKMWCIGELDDLRFGRGLPGVGRPGSRPTAFGAQGWGSHASPMPSPSVSFWS